MYDSSNDPDEKLVSTQDISLKKCYYYIMFRNIVFKKYKAKRDSLKKTADISRHHHCH